MEAFIGPVSYRINKGTALKWIASMENNTIPFDFAQLSFEGYTSPEGLLAKIACPNPTIAWDGVSHLYDGEQFKLSEGLRKSLKVKGMIPEFKSFAEAIESCKTMLSHFDWET